MPTEFIPASIPAERDALRRMLERAKAQREGMFTNSDVIAWVSFLWGASDGESIGINDLQELRDLLPTLGYNPTDEFHNIPMSPENQALSDTNDGDPIWQTLADLDRCGLSNSLHFYSGQMPNDSVIAWYAYLFGQFRARAVSETEYKDLVRMLPPLDFDPVALIIECNDDMQQD